jgi:SecD/SecF fusion protein
MMWNVLLPLAQAADTTLWERFARHPFGRETPLGADAQFWIKLGLAMAVVVAAYVAGRAFSSYLRMIDQRWKIGLIAFTMLAAGMITVLGYPPKRGIDLKGGVVLVYQIKKTDQDYNPDNLMTAIRKRIDPTGTKQISVRMSGERQVEMMIPDVGEEEVEQIKRQVVNLGTLEFRILAVKREVARAAKGALSLDAQQKWYPPEATKEEEIQVKWVPMEPKVTERYYDQNKDADGANLSSGLSKGFYTRVIRNDQVLKEPPAFRDRLPEDRFEILVIKDEYDVKGDYLSRVTPGSDENARPAVDFVFNTYGARQFSSLTQKYQPQGDFKFHLGIVLNGYLTSAPELKSRIGAQGQISGYDPNEQGRKERDSVIAVLQAGQLPAQLEEDPLLQFRMDGTLGADMVKKGLWAMAASLAAVLAFMLWYYRFSGIVANFALLANLLLIVAAMITIKAALTLPGLAGLMLTVGMAVDANVLIYERMREEMGRGASVRMAIRNGFAKAMSAIVDSNVTTIMSAIILYAIGTEQIRGFAVTLTLGIGMSLFTAIFCARLIFDVAEKRRWLTQLKMMKLMANPNYDFLGKAKPAIALSLIVIVIGMWAVWDRGFTGLMDIDFTGGTNAQIVFKAEELEPGKPINTANVRAALDQWNDKVAQLDKNGLLEELKLKGKNPDKVLRVVQLEFASVLKPSRQDDVPLSQSEIEAARRKFSLSLPLSKEEQDKLDKFYDALDDADFDDLRKYVASLPDMTVTEIHVGDADRFYVSTSNRRVAAVEGVLECVFEDKLATNKLTISDEAPPEKAEEGKATTPGGDKKAEDKPAGNKKADEKTAPAKSGAVARPAPAYFVSAAVDRGDSEVLLAQADTPGKDDGKSAPDSAKPPADGAKAKDEKKEAPAIAGPRFALAFDEAISKDKLDAQIRQAAEEAKLGTVQFKSDNPRYLQGERETFKEWTVALALPKDQAEKVLGSVQAKIAAEPRFPASMNVESQVSKDMQRKAIYAILASIVGMIIYLWVRFQKVSYGVAASTALVHDVLVTLAFMALSYHLSTYLGIPTIDPFKINLEIMAAFLTIIGFSVNDTIVIFDRIREIRGKSPVVTWEMVNRAVNQTFSRTILTSLTVFMVVAILYFFGGQGLHGFAFAMFVGVISGTYSTVYIASPVLLWLIKAPKTSTTVTPAQPQAQTPVRSSSSLFAGRAGS